MALTTEQFEQLPDFVKADYEKDGDVYRPIAEGKLSALKGSLNELDTKYRATDSQLKEILAKHEDDRTKVEQAALERLRKEGKVDEILADYERRKTESEAQYQSRIEKLASVIIGDKRALDVSSLAKELNIHESSEKLFSKLVQDRISVDPDTGKRTYLDENGGATSLDFAGFVEELKKDQAYYPLRKAAVPQGGMANGNNGNSGGAAKKPHEYNDAERVELFKTNPAKFKELFPTS